MNYLSRKILIIFIIATIAFANVIAVNGSIINVNQPISQEKICKLSNEKIELKIRLLMLIGHYPSISACIIKNTSIVWSGSYGFSNRLTMQRPNNNTIYMVASITKSIVATAMMQLFEQGNFTLDEDINNYLDFKVRNPNYPNATITFRMLLAHQSSLATSSLKENAIYTIYNKFSPQIFPNYPYPFIKERLLSNGSMYEPSVWLDMPPGTEYHYANNGFILLEYLIERLANQSFEEYCQKHIFEPLQMKNTSFHFSDFRKSQMAIPYIYLGGLYIRIPHYDPFAGMGGLRTSVEDLSHFLIAHMHGGMYKGICILNESNVKLMHKIQYNNSHYGLGWMFVKEGFQGHGGALPGCDSNMFMNESKDIGVIFFMNKMVNVDKKSDRWAYKCISNELFAKTNEYLTS
jgi:CubicO group peptidase (beta-lactamase class C family)